MIPNDKHELYDFLAKEDEMFAFADEIEKERAHLLSIEGDCYPWSLEHITEACEQYPSDEFENSNAMVKWVYEYWNKIAERLAEKNVYGRQ